MYTSNYSRGGGCPIIRRYSNCGELGYNACICKKDKEISNVYSFDWFQLIFNVVMDLFGKEDEQCEKVADSLVWPTRLSFIL